MNRRYDKYDEFNKKVIDTCISSKDKTNSYFKQVEECLALRDESSKKFSKDETNSLFLRCLEKKAYITDNDGEIEPVEVPKSILKCISCLTTNGNKCENYLDNSARKMIKQEEKKTPSCNCDESKTRTSRKKKKEEVERNEKKEKNVNIETTIKPKMEKAIVTIYPSIDSRENINSKPMKKSTSIKKKSISTERKINTVVFNKKKK